MEGEGGSSNGTEYGKDTMGGIAAKLLDVLEIKVEGVMNEGEG